MVADSAGWYEATVPAARAGTRYNFIIDGEMHVPDPASRFQPKDVHGPSEVIDPAAFDWSDEEWQGRPWEETVLYELHVGAFTQKGTFRAVIDRLDYLAELGVTAVELMPVADWPGERNWGYDGVYPFAPDARYGRPEDLKALVDAAHYRGLMMFLDVVYNHFGPEGNYLHRYAPQFFTDRYHTPWGAAINFDGPNSRPVRDFFIANALYWLHEYHFDGLRLDAVHAIHDQSHPDILTEIAQHLRAHMAPGRHVHLVLENDRNESRYLRREADGRPRQYTAQWNDDIHHVMHVLLTGERVGYYMDYADDAGARLARALGEGFVYQGDVSEFRGGARRGEPSADLPPTAFVSFLQNHDQVGNRAFGDRITEIAPPEAVRAAVAVLLLAPAPPLLFMGEEWGTRRRFPFFCDFGPELADSVREGRRKEFSRFPEFQDESAQARIPDPTARETFAAAMLDWEAQLHAPHQQWLAFYTELLALRRREIMPRLTCKVTRRGEPRILGERAVMVQWRVRDGATLTCIANLAPHEASYPEAMPSDRLLFATHELAAGDPMPPWTVAWFIGEPTR
jgi:1,4-alpha-glucan branching enzyme/maltooligosyltrehalose trehalohydrolase